MASLKELHQLVHTLNKKEKIKLNLYFKAFGAKSKQSYINDYQCFAKNKTYDKEKIIKELNKIKTRKNLSESNTNLYNFILDSLVLSNQSSNKKLGLLNEIQAIELMIDKGLLDQSKKHLSKLKASIKNSSRNEKISFYLMELENAILFNQPRNKSNYNERIKLIDEQIYFVGQADFTLRFKKLKTQLFDLISSIGIPRNKNQQAAYLKLINDDILSTDGKLIPRASYLDFFYAKHMLHIIAEPKNTEQAIDILKQGLVLTQQNVDIKTDYMPYFVLSGMLMQISCTGKNEKYAKESIHTFESFVPFFISKQHQVSSKVSLQTANLLFGLNFNKIDEAYDYINKNRESILDKENLKFNPNAYVTYLSSARVCFLFGDYELSLEFINLLLSIKSKIRISLIPSIRILYLLNHLKLKNSLYLPYAIRSVYKSFLKLGHLYEPEKAIISFFKTLVKKIDYKTDLENLYKKLIALKKDPFNNSFFGNGDYILWLEEELKKP